MEFYLTRGTLFVQTGSFGFHKRWHIFRRINNYLVKISIVVLVYCNILEEKSPLQHLQRLKTRDLVTSQVKIYFVQLESLD